MDDDELVEALTDGSWNMSFRCQPHSSPNLNVLDLGNFNSIQFLQYKTALNTIDDLTEVIRQSFDEFCTESSDIVLFSLQMAMQEIMRCVGGNNYKLRPMFKKKLRREGRLPVSLLCDPAVLGHLPPEALPNGAKY